MNGSNDDDTLGAGDDGSGGSAFSNLVEVRLRTELTPLILGMSLVEDALAEGNRPLLLEALDLIERAATACASTLGNGNGNHLVERKRA